MDLNIFNGSEFLKSVWRACQICGPLYRSESIPYFTVDLQLIVNDLGFFMKYEQPFFKISLNIGGDKPFKDL